MKSIKQTSLHAGRFSAWLRNIRNTLAERSGMNVPCGECNACCRSSFFIHIKPEETCTLRRIPKELLFPAPLLSKGHLVLGYNKHDRCPMLVRNKCSIYKNRPATCRIFDCRVLAASGIAGNENSLIARHAQRWKFNLPTKSDLDQLSAVEAAAAFLTKHPECIRDNLASRNTIRLSVLAIKVYDVFLNENSAASNPAKAVRVSVLANKVLKSYIKFERRKRTA